MNVHTLSRDEAAKICSLVADVASQFDSVEDTDFLADAGWLCHDLPRGVRRFLNAFKSLDMPGGGCIIRGYPICDEKIGKTPTHWRERSARSQTLEEEIYLLLLGSMLGDAFAWSTQQAGHLVHDVLPIKGHEQEQLGSSSAALLTWHTEDAFHPYSADYLLLMCLRNPDKVATLVASTDAIALPDEQKRVLFEPHFTIRPDESHLQKNSGGSTAAADPAVAAAYARIEQMNQAPSRIAVLYGDPKSPYMRLDPYFMDPNPDNPSANQALDALVQSVDAALGEVVLEAGDVFVIDNMRAVHGRQPFAARYDGYDRWLKRINVTRDLRKSRDARLSLDSRVIL